MGIREAALLKCRKEERSPGRQLPSQLVCFPRCSLATRLSLLFVGSRSNLSGSKVAFGP